MFSNVVWSQQQRRASGGEEHTAGASKTYDHEENRSRSHSQAGLLPKSSFSLVIIRGDQLNTFFYGLHLIRAKHHSLHPTASHISCLQCTNKVKPQVKLAGNPPDVVGDVCSSA